jgi:hypothetical protein
MQKRLLPTLACLSLALLAACSSASSLASKPTATATMFATAPTPTLTAAPSPSATPLPGTVAVSDATIASQLSFAFVKGNDVWVSLHGAAPQQVTHLGLPTQQLDWRLLWSADQTKLLATESNDFTGGTFQGESWIISLPGQTVTPLSDAAPLTAGCTISCGWLGDHNLVHADAAQVGSHAQIYHVYDTQTQRDLATRLDSQIITEWEARGTALYFTPYVSSTGNGGFVPGSILRFDLASNQITTAFSVSEGALVSEGISSANWDISADGSKIVYYFFGGALRNCLTGIPCKTIYQDSSGRVTAIFSSYQTGQAGQATNVQINAPIWISPAGNAAAGFITGDAASAVTGPLDTLVQQALPSGNGWSNALPQGEHPHDDWVLGWLGQRIIVARTERDSAEGNPLAASILVAPPGATASAHLVETIQAAQVAFAPLG